MRLTAGMPKFTPRTAGLNALVVQTGMCGFFFKWRQHMLLLLKLYYSSCRSAYDLSKHTAASGTKLVARRILKEPQTVEVLELEWDKKKMGPAFKKDAKFILETVEAYDQERRACVQRELEKDGETEIDAHNGQKYKVSSEHLKIVKRTSTKIGKVVISCQQNKTRC